MIFLVTLLSLLTERFFHWGHLRKWRWLFYYQQWLTASRLGKQFALLVIFAILPPVFLVGALQALLSNHFYHIPLLLFDILIFLYCLGPENLWLEFQPTASVSARNFFLAANSRVLAVLFWFCLLGPVGAMLYRVIALSAEGRFPFAALAGRARSWLDWLPVRFFAFIFALGGHFTEVIRCYKRYASKGPAMNETLFVESGMAALDRLDTVTTSETEMQEALALLDRVLLMFFVLLALLVVMG